MKTHRNGVVGATPEDIGDMLKGLDLAIPEIDEATLLAGIDGMDERVRAIVEAEGKVRESVSTAVRVIRTIEHGLNHYKDNPRALRAAKAQYADSSKNAADRLEQLLSLRDETLRASATVAFVQATLSGEFVDFDETAKAVGSLVEKGVLTPAKDREGIMLGRRWYNVPPKWGVIPEDIQEIKTTTRDFSNRMFELLAQRQREQAQEVEAEASITLDDARQGKTGKCFVYVPEDRERRLPGGRVLLEFTSDVVIPVVATGHIQKDVEEMTEMGVYLECYTLAWDAAPGSGSSYQRLLEVIQNREDITKDEAVRYASCLRKLWGYVKRAVAYQDQQKEQNAVLAEARTSMKARATATAVEVFGLNGNGGVPQEGTAFVEYNGTFYLEGQPNISNVFLLVTVARKDNPTTVTIDEVPEHLTGLLGEFVGKPFSMDNNLRDVPGVAGRVLRAVRGQVNRTCKVEAAGANDDQKAD